MAGVTLVVRESKSADQMCRQQSRFSLRPEEARAAKESLLLYYKPVKLYNMLQLRATHNPLFLQRCLSYNIQAKHKRRLGTGNVQFKYNYYNDTLQKTEVTEDFTCPFCLARCGSFKGLKYHLLSSHDLFSFDFGVPEEQQVTVKLRTDVWKSEVMNDGGDAKLQTFSYRSKLRRCRRLKKIAQNVNHVQLRVLEVDSPEAALESSHVGYPQDTGIGSSLGPMTYPMLAEPPNGLNDGSFHKVGERPLKALLSETQLLPAWYKSESYGSESDHAADCTELVTSSPDADAHASPANEFAQLVCGNNPAPTRMLQFSKTRKLSVERADPRNRAPLQKRQFFHSQGAQPLAPEQLFSDRDSEDEVDADIADIEERRMLDDFVDVTENEKRIMHLWNSFVRKQRVLADGHIPWACEAFSRLHGKDLGGTPGLVWSWRLFMIKLWNHSLLDARTMNNCNLILESYKNEILGQKQS